MYSFVKTENERDERFNTSFKTTQNDRFASFVCQTAENFYSSYCSSFLVGEFFKKLVVLFFSGNRLLSEMLALSINEDFSLDLLPAAAS